MFLLEARQCVGQFYVQTSGQKHFFVSQNTFEEQPADYNSTVLAQDLTVLADTKCFNVESRDEGMSYDSSSECNLEF